MRSGQIHCWNLIRTFPKFWLPEGRHALQSWDKTGPQGLTNVYTWSPVDVAVRCSGRIRNLSELQTCRGKKYISEGWLWGFVTLPHFLLSLPHFLFSLLLCVDENVIGLLPDSTAMPFPAPTLPFRCGKLYFSGIAKIKLFILHVGFGLGILSQQQENNRYHFHTVIVWASLGSSADQNGGQRQGSESLSE